MVAVGGVRRDCFQLNAWILVLLEADAVLLEETRI